MKCEVRITHPAAKEVRNREPSILSRLRKAVESLRDDPLYPDQVRGG